MRRAVASAACFPAILAGCAPRTDYDPDRLRGAQMERIVAVPIKTVRAGDLAEGERQVERLRALRVAARPHDPYAAADVDESFGVLLVQEHDEQDLLRRAALPYLARAAREVRAAKGPSHPELALALHTYGDALHQGRRPVDQAPARTAYCAAYRIRRASLGAEHPEAGAALVAVARTRPGSPAMAAYEALSQRPRPLEWSAPFWSALTGDDLVAEHWLDQDVARDPRFVALCPAANR